MTAIVKYTHTSLPRGLQSSSTGECSVKSDNHEHLHSSLCVQLAEEHFREENKINLFHLNNLLCQTGTTCCSPSPSPRSLHRVLQLKSLWTYLAWHVNFVLPGHRPMSWRSCSPWQRLGLRRKGTLESQLCPERHQPDKCHYGAARTLWRHKAGVNHDSPVPLRNTKSSFRKMHLTIPFKEKLNLILFLPSLSATRLTYEPRSSLFSDTRRDLMGLVLCPHRYSCGAEHYDCVPPGQPVHLTFMLSQKEWGRGTRGKAGGLGLVSSSTRGKMSKALSHCIPFW